MKGKEKKIQDYDFWYSSLRPYLDWLFRLSVRHYRCIGRNNLPTDGSIIYAPNHQHALLDALAILTIDSKPKVFVSRADIHRKPRLAAILKWLKIMPINRMRDGVDSVRHNDETNRKAVEVLHDGIPFCIMPEGTHRRKHSLLPLQKGIFRIAMQAADGSQPIYIVPVGLYYGDWAHMWSSLVVNIGQPVNVTEYLLRHPDQTEPQQILGMREILTERMRGLIPYVPDNDQYEANWQQLKQHMPEPWNTPERKCPKWMLTLLLIVFAPLYALSAIATFPIWILPACLKHKIKDISFYASIRFVWTWTILPFSLFLALPFWLFMEEYKYLFIRLKS